MRSPTLPPPKSHSFASLSLSLSCLLSLTVSCRRLKLFLEKKGTKVDVAECKRLHPALLDFEGWCVKNNLHTKKFEKSGLCTVQ